MYLLFLHFRQKPTRPSSRLSESNTPTRNIANYTKGSNNKTGYTQIQQNKHSGISKEITANVKGKNILLSNYADIK